MLLREIKANTFSETQIFWRLAMSGQCEHGSAAPSPDTVLSP